MSEMMILLCVIIKVSIFEAFFINLYSFFNISCCLIFFIIKNSLLLIINDINLKTNI